MENLFFIVLLAVVCVFVLFRLFPSLGKTRKEKIEDEFVERTHALYKQACQIDAFDTDAFIKIANATFEDGKVRAAALELFAREEVAKPDPPPEIVTGIEGGRYRDYLERYINQGQDDERNNVLVGSLCHVLEPLDRIWDDDGIFNARQRITREEVVTLMARTFEVEPRFESTRQQLLANLMENGGKNALQYRDDDYPYAYLKNTPLEKLEYRATMVPWNNREAHTLVLGGSGSGKTTLFKHLIAKLLEEDCCVVVMDSQSQVIEELAHLKLNESDVTWLSPENALALNPFDIDPKDQRDETVINNKISLLEFVVENLIEAPMTPRQKNLFYFCTQLVLAIPGGNVKTFKEVLKDPFVYSDTIETLDETARDFFFKELKEQSGNRKGNSYDSTRQELAYRLDGLTKQPTFRRIFQTKENTFDFFDEMQKRKLILLDTSQSLLADDSPTLGRFLIANALQACFQRVHKKQMDRPVYFFVDEAHEYFDEKLERMLLQARKANVGMVLATQDLSRATKAGIADTLIGSTSTQIVSKVIAGDAKRLAPAMKTNAEFITDLSDHTFGYFSGQDIVSIQVNGDPLSQVAKRGDLNSLKRSIEFRYGPKPEMPTFDPKPNADTESVNSEPTVEDTSTSSEQNRAEENKPPVAKQKPDKPIQQKPQKSQPKPKAHNKPKQKPPMIQNEVQDIEPGDQL